MKFKHLFAGLVATLALGAATTAGIFASNSAKKEAKAATETTVYYNVPSTTVGTYTVKCNVNRQGDGDNWASYNMTKTDKTYNSNPIYSVTFTDLYNGLGALQFQLYDGSTWKSQVQPISGWTSASTYNGKMWVHGGSSWSNYQTDPDAPVTHTFGLVGNRNSWGSDFASFVEQQNGTFVASNVALTKGELFKIRADGLWDNSWGVGSISGTTNYFQANGNNIEVLVSGTYTFTLPANFFTSGSGATFTITPAIANGAYLRGSVIGWDEEDQVAMTATGNANEYSITRNLAANEQIKVFKYNAGVASFIDPSSYDCNHSAAYPIYLGGEYNNNPTVTNAGGYTIKVNVSTGAYHFYANDFVTPTAQIAYSNGSNGETSSYNETNQQSEILVYLNKDEAFTVKHVTSFGTFYRGYDNLEEGTNSSRTKGNVTKGSLKEGSTYYINVATSGLYLLYVKDSGSIWMQDAEPSPAAHNWATYFLANVGCDANGVNEPSGWTAVSNRYATLTDEAKALIVAADADENSSDEIEQAMARYDYAVTHHTGLTRFIVGRTISNPSGSRSLSANSVVEAAAPATVAVVGLVSVTAVGGFFFLKKKPF